MHARRVEVEVLIDESNYQGGEAFESYPVLDFVPVAEVAALVQAEHFSHERSAMSANIIRGISCETNWWAR